MQKILHTTYDLGYGGIQEAIRLYLKYSKEKEFHQTVWGCADGKLRPHLEKVADKVLFGNTPKEFEGYDLIVAHDVNGTYPIWLDATAKHTPIINFHHCVYRGLVPKEKFVCQLTTSESNRAILGEDYELVGLPMELPNYTEDFRPGHGFTKDDFIVGRIGRFEGVKRVKDFVEAAALIKEKIPTAKFVLAGGDNYFGDTHAYVTDLKKRAEELGVEITWVRGFPQEDKTNLLSMFDVFLYPTTEEGYCLSIVEAMLANVMVATYDNMANRKTLGGHGIIVPTGDTIKLADEVVAYAKRRGDIELMQQEDTLEDAYVLASERNAPSAFADRVDMFINKYL